MRSRYTLPLYSHDPLDAQIMDYLEENAPAPRKGRNARRTEIIRSLMRFGFLRLINNMDHANAINYSQSGLLGPPAMTPAVKAPKKRGPKPKTKPEDPLVTSLAALPIVDKSATSPPLSLRDLPPPETSTRVASEHEKPDRLNKKSNKLDALRAVIEKQTLIAEEH